ncbi:MAG: 50S ribosomal protein L21 [Omnitrophica bacterium RIFCSPHIGHO2_02_FULL_49_9]|nr:MAG: 50S ribosomal protein L21 [Omnitrophica bacterium RIFCSPHIGHO2_02_FULL_49_9]OGW89727.1 MAG: 50S ribosomal protein L21 [Omnitrophica bacterium RIFCSPLOWO2_01_FULL_50_24]
MSKYAVVQVGTHQYRVEENTEFNVERFDLPKDGKVELDQVLAVQKKDQIEIGTPFVSKASVLCDVVTEFRAPKVISFKFKRRKNYRKKKGHRQSLVRLRVKTIKAG